MGSQTHILHTRAFSFPISILLLLVFSLTSPGQSPSPTPGTRDLGLQPNQQPNSQANQNKPKQPKPELVLQTGYNNFYGATRMGFSPDGRLLATATFHTNTIKLWETATGRELRNLSPGGANTSSMSPVFAWSPDSRLLVASGGNNTFIVWDVTSGREVQTLSSATGSFMGAFGVSFAAFSSDGRKLVTISDAIHLWDTATWRELTNIQTANLNPSAMMGGSGGAALSADSTQLVRVDNDQIRFLDPMTGKELRSVPLPDPGMHTVELVFTSDGRLLAAGAEDKKVRVWDVNSKSDRVKATTQHDVVITRFSGDGRLVAIADGYSVRVWDTTSGKEVST